eukprot:166731-Chlamydomonas_euryale.AAC.1
MPAWLHARGAGGQARAAAAAAAASTGHSHHSSAPPTWDAELDDLDMQFSLSTPGVPVIPAALSARDATSTCPTMAPEHDAWRRQAVPEWARSGDNAERRLGASAGGGSAPDTPTSFAAPRHVHAVRGNLDDRQLSDRALTRAITSCRGAAQLHELWACHRARLNHVHVAALLHALARARDALAPRHGRAVAEMLRHLDGAFAASLPRYGPREVSISVWAWGKLAHLPSPGTWCATADAIAGACEGGGWGGDGAGSDGVAGSGGVAGSDAVAGSGVATAVPLGASPSARPLLSTATPQALAMLAWGLYHVRCRDDRVWGALARGALASARVLSPRDASNVLWAFAAAGRHDIRLFSTLSDVLAARAADMSPQDLSNSVWALGVTGHPHTALLDAAAGAAVALLRGFTPQGLANTLWAYSTLRRPAPALFACACGEAAARVASFEPRHLSMTAWAVARSGHRDPQLMAAISGAAQLDLQ